MDRVRARERIDLEPERLVERLPQRDRRIAAVLLARDAEEPRGRVDEHHADPAIEDPPPQPVEQRAGAGGVVEQEVAVLERAREVLDGEVEAAVPDVRVDVVIGEAGGLVPVLVRRRHEALRPPEPAARRSSGALSSRCSSSSPPTAAAPPRPQPHSVAMPKPCDVLARGGDPPSRAVGVARVDQPEVELGLRGQAQLAERREVAVVLAVGAAPAGGSSRAGGRAAASALATATSFAASSGSAKWPLLVVAVTEVVAELDLRGHEAPEPQQPLDDAGLHVVEPDLDRALQHRELVAGVPLDRELVGRDRREDALDLGLHLRLVDRLELGLVLERHERADRRERRGQRDEEAAARGDRALALEPRERVVRRRSPPTRSRARRTRGRSCPPRCAGAAAAARGRRTRRAAPSRTAGAS